jgi:hypothetical protein
MPTRRAHSGNSLQTPVRSPAAFAACCFADRLDLLSQRSNDQSPASSINSRAIVSSCFRRVRAIRTNPVAISYVRALSRIPPSARSESSPPYSENSATRLARSPGLFRRVYDSNFLGNRLESTAIESPTKTFPPGRGCQLKRNRRQRLGEPQRSHTRGTPNVAAIALGTFFARLAFCGSQSLLFALLFEKSCPPVLGGLHAFDSV